MIEAIVLTSDGDTMVGQSAMRTATDETSLQVGEVGRHEYCEGPIEFRRIAAGNSALVCRLCHLRVVVPRNTVATFGDLRRYLAELQPDTREAT
jgi:hypothetical protein